MEPDKAVAVDPGLSESFIAKHKYAITLTAVLVVILIVVMVYYFVYRKKSTTKTDKTDKTEKTEDSDTEPETPAPRRIIRRRVQIQDQPTESMADRKAALEEQRRKLSAPKPQPKQQPPPTPTPAPVLVEPIAIRQSNIQDIINDQRKVFEIEDEPSQQFEPPAEDAPEEVDA